MGSNVSRKKVRQKILDLRKESGTEKVKRVKKQQ